MTHEEFIKTYLQNKNWHITDGVLYIKSGLQLSSINISELPENLNISGFLNLYETNITILPKNLIVRGYLYLYGTKIKTLPEKLSVGVSLYLSGSNITKIPDDFKLGHRIHSGHKLSMCEEMQMKIININSFNFEVIKTPTEKVIALQNLLWKL